MGFRWRPSCASVFPFSAGFGQTGLPLASTYSAYQIRKLLFNAVAPDQAQVSCYFTVVTHVGLDHFGRYRDTLVPDGGTWLIKHRKVSTDWAAPDSTMARHSTDR